MISFIMSSHVNDCLKEEILTDVKLLFKVILDKFKLNYHSGLMCDKDNVR